MEKQKRRGSSHKTGNSRDTVLSARLVDQLIDRVTVNGSDDVSIQFRFESDFDCIREAVQLG